MQRLLARLERRFGNYALHGITYYLVAIQAFVFVVELTNPGFVQMLSLNRELIMRGQVWRLFTYLFIPPTMSPLWVLFELYWLHLIGTSLEAQWGSFQYQFYWIVGMVLTTIAAFGFNLPATTNVDLLMSLFLAFATLFPDFEIRVFLLIPVKVKWLALLDAAAILARIGFADGMGKIVPLLAIGNYLLFFTPTLIDQIRAGAFTAHRAGARRKFKRDITETKPVAARRTCKTCGVTDEDRSVDFRVCACEKCGGVATDFCLAHARSH